MPDPRLSSLRSGLDPTQPTPLYHQVRLRLETWVARNLQPGEELPTEGELGEAFAVSRVTVRQAIQELLTDRVLYRPKPRSRLRRATARVHQELMRLPGFFRDDILAAGMDPTVTVLRAGVTRDERIAEILRTHADADLARIERLHSGSGQPMALQVSYLPLALFPDLFEQDLSASLFRITADQYGLEVTGAKQRLYARECRPDEAEILRLPNRSPALVVERVSYSASRVPIEFFHCCLAPDSYDFTFALGDLADANAKASDAAPPRIGADTGSETW